MSTAANRKFQKILKPKIKIIKFQTRHFLERNFGGRAPAASAWAKVAAGNLNIFEIQKIEIKTFDDRAFFGTDVLEPRPGGIGMSKGRCRKLKVFF